MNYLHISLNYEIIPTEVIIMENVKKWVTIQRKNAKEVKKDLTWFLDKKVKMSWQ